MSDSPLRERLAVRFEMAGVAVDPSILAGLERYLDLLARWNARINLTALPVQPPTDAALDKLLVEPLVAAPFYPSQAGGWIDLGSGGGSPALPLRLACRSGALALVESRERKCAFLREAVRVLGLERTTVTTARFEVLQVASPVDVVTVRAVRVDAEMEGLVCRILRVGGLLFCFGTPLASSNFEIASEAALPDGSLLTVARRVI
ncbi:MAG: 16S rRNA (guanine(527)-N(7))-methyltransferase RsmG [Vicinamibacterales bacterium]